ncbi:MAG TPA: ATP-binding protein [Candidatus Mcinerneyibacteriales bacterium]|nr:ATP-binding protein [Candidatus Mcinerneyibacteriales bacterium]
MMPELSLHIMDIMENGIAAGAWHLDLFIDIDTAGDWMEIIVVDNGKGMDTEMIQKAMDPLFSTKKGKGWGLGIPLFMQTAEACDGGFDIESKEGTFTRVKVGMRLSHIDRPPLGNITDTLLSLIVGHPEIDLYVMIKKDGAKYEFDTRVIREILGDVSLATPQVLGALEEDISAGLEELDLTD